MIERFSLYDFKEYFQKNKKVFLLLLFFFFIGIIAGIFVAVTSDSYLSLMTTRDKVFYDYVNGKADFSKEVVKLIFNFLIFQIIVFLLNLNFYSGLISYLLIAYQSSLMFLSMVAVVSKFGFGGIVRIVFLMLPINVVLIASNILFSGICFVRCFNARLNKKFSYGFDDKRFWLAIVAFVLFGILFSYLINFLFVIVLKRRFFIIF